MVGYQKDREDHLDFDKQVLQVLGIKDVNLKDYMVDFDIQMEAIQNRLVDFVSNLLFYPLVYDKLVAAD